MIKSFEWLTRNFPLAIIVTTIIMAKFVNKIIKNDDANRKEQWRLVCQFFSPKSVRKSGKF